MAPILAGAGAGRDRSFGRRRNPLPSSPLEVACWRHDLAVQRRPRIVGTPEDGHPLTTTPAVEAIDLVKHFGDTRAVDGVSFVVPTGSVLGLLGPNGAGKTTLVRMLTTLSVPTSGTGRVAGFDIIEQPNEVRRSMGLTGQAATVDEILTGRENLRLIGSLYGLPKRYVREVSDTLLERFDLAGAADRMAKTYSGGMRRRLDLAVSLLAAPPILFLDEPTTGLDPQSRSGLWAVLRELVQEGTTLVLTTQYLEEADHLADEIVVVDKGKVIAAGTPTQLKDQAGRASVVVTLTHAADLDRAAELMNSCCAEVHVERGSRRLTAQASGLGDMTRIASVFESSGIELDDLGLARPSLDDVFLHLTGHRAESDDAADDADLNTEGVAK
jgi:ABC-2 type transport system ATP-binding protein